MTGCSGTTSVGRTTHRDLPPDPHRDGTRVRIEGGTPPPYVTDRVAYPVTPDPKDVRR